MNRPQTLFAAAEVGDVQALRTLIGDGADPNAVDSGGLTALHWAAVYGHAEAVDLLLRAGARVNAVADFGGTPLHWAAARGRTEAVNLLLRAGADVDARDMYGRTPRDVSPPAFRGPFDRVVAEIRCERVKTSAQVRRALSRPRL